MKKLVCLLLTLTMLLMNIVPALAEATAPVITVTEFKDAMNKLAKDILDIEMEWTTVDAFTVGNLGGSPALITSGEYVTAAMVVFSMNEGDDSDTIANLFMLVSALTAAVPAVRDGQATKAAGDAALQALLPLFSSEENVALGTVNGSSTMIMMSDNDEGGIDLTLLITYTDPNAQ